MTMPVAAPVALPVVPDASTPLTGAPDDVFAAVLAALSGALGVPAPPAPASSPADAAHGSTAVTHAAGTPVAATLPLPTVVSSPPGGVEGPAVLAQAAGTAVSTGVASSEGSVVVGPPVVTHGEEVRRTTWHAMTQRAVVDTSTGAVRVTQATEHPPTASTLAASTGAPEQPSAPAFSRDEQPVVPEVLAAVPAPTAPTVEAPAVVTAGIAASSAPATEGRIELPAQTGPTRHVQPAVLEAARGLRHEGGGRTSLVVRLDPPELGAVLVRLTVQDGRVDVQLRTPDLAARADLQAQSYDVQQVLREQGFDLSSFDVSQGDVFSSSQGDAPDRGTPQQARRADGRAGNPHVTDDAPAPEPSGTWL